jgi:two-component system sensor histidine kinase BaeS
VLSCVRTARREQLTPYVAPPALLFVTDPGSTTVQPSFSLTRENLLRIGLGTAVVLAAATAVTVAVGLRLARPLRRLAEAARRPIDQQHPVAVTTKDEIGSLASALNDLSDRRDRLEEQRRAMVGDVAHELRTPLANMRSWLDAAQDQVVPAGPQLLALLSEETFLLQRIVDDLRDLAAADAGTLRLHCDYVYVNDVLTGVAQAHQGAAAAAGIQLSTDFRADPQMSVDPVRIRQIVGNLVSNAFRHSDSGHPVVIRTRMETGALAIDVIDEGTGIEPGALGQVFDRFWRADSSRSRVTGGSGLGLAIARELTSAHDGTISVVSELGVGSTFTVRLPASRQAPTSSL